MGMVGVVGVVGVVVVVVVLVAAVAVGGDIDDGPCILEEDAHLGSLPCFSSSFLE